MKVTDLELTPEAMMKTGEAANFETLLDFLTNNVIPVSINTAHPAYMGYIPCIKISVYLRKIPAALQSLLWRLTSF